MEKVLKILVGVVSLFFTTLPGVAQLYNGTFTEPQPGRQDYEVYDGKLSYNSQKDNKSAAEHNACRDSLKKRLPVQFSQDSLAGYAKAKAGDLHLALHSFTFFKDNEYFNDIVQGYTLFGTQLNPQLVYYPTKDLRLEGGVFLWKDFGNSQLRRVRPTFRGTWTVKNHQFIFGNIKPHLYHGYIEPLLDFERVILKPLEEGLQYRYVGSRLFLDVWVDWVRQQYPGSNYQEQIAGGLSSRFRLTGANSPVAVGLPFQFTARHFGGQIDTLYAPIQTLFNYAAGVEARKTFSSFVVQGLRLNAYGLLFDDHSFGNYRLPYQSGSGLYLNGTLETRYAEVMLSYWQGNTFYAPLGGPYYQSVASRYGTPGYTDARRRLLYLRLLRDFRILDAAAVTVRVEPVYDFSRSLLDYSFGVYLNFRQEWLLGNVGKRVRVGQ